MPNESLQPGDKVEHLKHLEWGQGTVISIDEYRAVLRFGGNPFGPFKMDLLRKVEAEPLKVGDLVENIEQPDLDYRRVNFVSANGKQISLELLTPGLTGPFLASNYRKVEEGKNA